MKVTTSILRFIIFPALIGFNNLAFASADTTATNPREIYIKIKLAKPSAVKVTAAPLKYNKHFAFSFTVDDGYRSAYLTAFPLLNGGKVSGPFPDEWKNDEGGDGGISKGLFYSDGCGNLVPFKMAVALNAASVGDMPLNRGHLSWPEVKELYNAGWDILNHGYHHATKHGTDYDTEVAENISFVKKQLGLTMTQFVVPGGESDPGYEHLYEKAAFKNGELGVASIGGVSPITRVDGAVKLDSLIHQRDFICSRKDNAVVAHELKIIDSLVKQPHPVWYDQFSHGVGNSNLWGISLLFPEFKYYMAALADKYGVKGADNMWMAPYQEVYEYIWLRDRIRINTQLKGSDLLIKVSLPAIPFAMRHKAISLNVPASFTILSQSKGLKVTHGSKDKHGLINVEL
ncbi:polysaccharide deacetylase family protein [Mucilaginibacter agri]|uniref:Polysaccharide deacetylase family protein n=1 Tax=Mucilaginibacter agri TaxID=2695265 RepID=A0A965ZJ73_9SPHI|nr:polysaccharide deacetylase family protein [Mucilaginibacter agri]NCD70712.1 polysaccharide deacetylase family protein [Mucilaginibacter agri]